MSEFAPRPAPEAPGKAEVRRAPETGQIDWRRLEVATGRFSQNLVDGLSQALENKTEIDHGTARVIAHVLGRGIGRESKLAEFGRTGQGDYLELREEYLNIYAQDEAPASTKELIDWFGTYLIQRDNHQNPRRFQNEHLPPKLERTLVPTGIEIGDWYLTIHVPADHNQAAIEKLTDALADLHAGEEPVLQAFLTLPDVNAATDNLLEAMGDAYIGDYSDIEAAVHELAEVDERVEDVVDFANERQMHVDDVNADYEALYEILQEGYDLVEHGGRVYVFYK